MKSESDIRKEIKELKEDLLHTEELKRWSCLRNRITALEWVLHDNGVVENE